MAIINKENQGLGYFCNAFKFKKLVNSRHNSSTDLPSVRYQVTISNQINLVSYKISPFSYLRTECLLLDTQPRLTPDLRMESQGKAFVST